MLKVNKNDNNTVEQTIKLWIEKYPNDKDKISQMNENERKDAFGKNIKFGTAGIRGIMTPGTNRFNVPIVSKITLGIISYMKEHGYKSVVICYDTRNNSLNYAELIYKLFNSFDVKTLISSSPLPSPYLSFCVRELKFDLGIMITASHNSREYNGYKVYNSEGCQISEETAEEIQNHIQNIDIFNLPYSLNNDILFNYIDKQLLDRYIEKSLSVCDSSVSTEHINVLYTPLHGVGLIPTINILKKLSYVDYRVVLPQAFPDSDFSTCPKPNPENPDAWVKAFECAENEDIIIATDPDADRAGIAVRTDEKYKILSGNEEAALILNYLCEREKDKSKIEGKEVVRSFVTTTLLDRIAEKNKLNLKAVETGFKNICKDLNPDTFLLGTEEAIGNLVTTHVRDKDAASTIVILVEMTAYYKKQNKTLIDVLEDIDKKYGIVRNTQIALEGIPKEKVISVIKSNTSDLKIKEESKQGNNEAFITQDNIKMIVRASGTEKKTKIYLEGYDADADKSFSRIKKLIMCNL